MALNFAGAYRAANLEPADADALQQMIAEFNAKLAGNQRRKAYYDDTVSTDMLGLSLPEKMQSIDTSNGWAAKTVDMLADRSILSGVTMDGDLAETMAHIVSRTKLLEKYRKGKTSQLMHCCGFWTVNRADSMPVAPGASLGVAINYRDAETAYAWWDKANDCIERAFTIDGWHRRKNGTHEPSVITVYTPTSYIVLKRVDRSKWVAEYRPHQNGCCMIVAMPYHATEQRPFGRSRITRAVRANVQAAKREAIRLEVHSEFHSTGQKWAMGVDDSMFDLDRFTLACHSFLMATRDENGDVPTVGQFQQQSPEAHIAVMEHLACRMASESNIPVSAFGVLGNGYTSSEALNASSNNLLLESNAMAESNGDALREVGRLAMAVALNKTPQQLTDEERAVKVTWADASMAAAGARSDFAVKVAGVVDGYGDSRVCLEQLGFDSDTCDRIEGDRKAAEELRLATAAFGVGNADNQ